MLAISWYEKTQNIPSGYINHAIARSAPNGAWSQIERGEIPLDEAFYAKFTRDLSSPAAWEEYCKKKLDMDKVPPMPAIDGKFLFWDMMRVCREYDPFFGPAIRKIREITEQGNGAKRKYVVGALTNDYKLPEGHEYSFNNERGEMLRSLFDVWISSAETGMRKPEGRIYELAGQKLSEKRKSWYGGDDGEGMKPDEVVFLDDIGTNLKGANQVGFTGIRVVLGETWKALRELEGVLGLTEGALFENGVMERLKREGKWGGNRHRRDPKL